MAMKQESRGFLVQIHWKAHRLWISLCVHWSPRQINPVNSLAADLRTIDFTILPATPRPTSKSPVQDPVRISLWWTLLLCKYRVAASNRRAQRLDSVCAR